MDSKSFPSLSSKVTEATLKKGISKKDIKKDPNSFLAKNEEKKHTIKQQTDSQA